MQCAAALLACAAGAASAGDLKVVVRNVQGSEGTVRVGLFNNAGEFPKGPLFRGQEQAAAPGEVVVMFKDLPAGDYAIIAYQDRNGNGDLDKNVIGIPVEPLGFSRGAWITSGPPAFGEAKFSFDGASQTQAVGLR